MNQPTKPQGKHFKTSETSQETSGSNSSCSESKKKREERKRYHYRPEPDKPPMLDASFRAPYDPYKKEEKKQTPRGSSDER